MHRHLIVIKLLFQQLTLVHRDRISDKLSCNVSSQPLRNFWTLRFDELEVLLGVFDLRSVIQFILDKFVI